MFDLAKVQDYMQASGIDAWLVYDFRGSNPVFWQLLGERRNTTRRVFLIIPDRGAPQLIGSVVEPEVLAGFDLKLAHYASWVQMEGMLREHVGSLSRVAMEYSPGGALPIMSWVDGGTLDLVRGLGPEVVSSADISQVALAVWNVAALESHRDVCREVAEVKDLAFEHIRYGLANHSVLTEHALQEFISDEFARRRLDEDHPAIVGVNANSGNPHYAPSAADSAVIADGDWVLIDLWARHPGEQNVFGDITWVGYAGSSVPEPQMAVFSVVKEARDAVVACLREAWQEGEVLQGWQLDRVAREIIDGRGYGEYYVHRTGHSLGPGPTVHALGVNLDDLETHDERQILPGTGFSVEPGIYLPEFGVRLEINMYVDPETGPEVTTPLQDEVVLLA